MSRFIKKIAYRYQHLNYREKVLPFIFVLFLSLFWVSGCFKQTRTLFQNWKFTNAKIKNHRFWIRNKSIIETNLEKVLEVMDPQKTFSGATFAGEVENVIRNYDLNYSMSSPRTRNSDIFDIHTLQLHCENAKLEDLIKLEESIYQKKPYLSLEKIKLHGNLFNPELLEVDFSLCSLQLKDILNGK
jgi:hypothetical protein